MTCRIKDVRFAPRTNDGPLDCTCGWSGLASAYDEHRHARRRPAGPRPCPEGHAGPFKTLASGARRCIECARRQNAESRERMRARMEVTA